MRSIAVVVALIAIAAAVDGKAVSLASPLADAIAADAAISASLAVTKVSGVCRAASTSSHDLDRQKSLSCPQGSVMAGFTFAKCTDASSKPGLKSSVACISGTEILAAQEEEEESKTSDTSDGGGVVVNMANVPAVECPVGAALASWRLIESSGASLAIEYSCRPCVVQVKTNVEQEEKLCPYGTITSTVKGVAPAGSCCPGDAARGKYHVRVGTCRTGLYTPPVGFLTGELYCKWTGPNNSENYEKCTVADKVQNAQLLKCTDGAHENYGKCVAAVLAIATPISTPLEKFCPYGTITSTVEGDAPVGSCCPGNAARTRGTCSDKHKNMFTAAGRAYHATEPVCWTGPDTVEGGYTRSPNYGKCTVSDTAKVEADPAPREVYVKSASNKYWGTGLRMGNLKIRGADMCLNHRSRSNRKRSWGPLQMWPCNTGSTNNQWVLDPTNNRIKAYSTTDPGSENSRYGCLDSLGSQVSP